MRALKRGGFWLALVALVLGPGCEGFDGADAHDVVDHGPGDAGIGWEDGDAAGVDELESVQLASLNPGRTYLRCETVTNRDGVVWRYQTAWFASELSRTTVEVRRDEVVQGSLTLDWSDHGHWNSTHASLTLEPRVGGDGVLLLAPHISHAVPGASIEARAANGFCVAHRAPSCTPYEVDVCTGGPQERARCQCLWTGEAPRDPVGQAVLDTLFGGPLKLFVRGVLGLVSAGVARVLKLVVGLATLAVLVRSTSATPSEEAAIEYFVERELASRRPAMVDWLTATQPGALRVISGARPSLGEMLSAARTRQAPLQLVRDASGRLAVVAGAAPAGWRAIVAATHQLVDTSSLADSLVLAEEVGRQSASLVVTRRDLAALAQ